MAGYCRCEKPKVDTTIDTSHLGSLCDVYHALLNKKLAIQAGLIRGPLCDPERFDVQHQLTSAMVYQFILTDNEDGSQVSWSVDKLYLKETPQYAFQRDYIESALRYNSGVRRALEDHVEALQEQFPLEGFQLEATPKGFWVKRDITGTVGLVPFQLDLIPVPGKQPEGQVTDPGIWGVIGEVPGEAGRALARLVQRYLKLGVVFQFLSPSLVNGLTINTLVGSTPCNEESHIQFVIRLRDHIASDVQLVTAHTYYTA